MGQSSWTQVLLEKCEIKSHSTRWVGQMDSGGKCVVHGQTDAQRWGGVCALGGGGGVWDDGWLRGLRADCGWARDRHTQRESKQATQVAVSQKPACVCCWPLHISTTLPQFVFCVLWPQMNFLPPSFFFFPHTIPFKMLPPHQKHTHRHTHQHLNTCAHKHPFYKYYIQQLLMLLGQQRVCVATQIQCVG